MGNTSTENIELMHLTSICRACVACAMMAALSLQLAGCGGTKQAESRASLRWSVPSDEAIAALLAWRMERNGVGMVVGVIDGPRRSVIAHGARSAGNRRPVDGGTVFQIGSLSKVTTSLLLADMVARGEVRLDDPVSQSLPAGVTMLEVGRPVTLRHLATHTSGLPSMPTNFDIRGEPDPYAAYPVDSIWSFLSTFKPDNPPGTAYEYSNLGVSLLGLALALRLGTTYEALLKERVLTPLGMSSTSITLNADQLERLAPGHGPDLQPIGGWEMVTLQASGSLRSTAEDMLLLLQAFLGRGEDPRLLKATAIQLREGLEVDGTFRPLGLGLRSDGTYAHAGGKEGYRSGLAFNPGTGVGAVVLANTRTYDSEPMAIALHLVTGEPLPPVSAAPEAKPRIQMSSEELERFAGRYRGKGGQEFEIVVAGQLLRIRYPNSSIFEFVPSGRLEFFYNAGNDDITFKIDAEGRVISMTVYGDGRREGDGQFVERINE